MEQSGEAVKGKILGTGVINTALALGALRSFRAYRPVVEDLELKGGVPLEVDIVAVNQRNGSKQFSFLYGNRPYTVVTLNEVFFIQHQLFDDCLSSPVNSDN